MNSTDDAPTERLSRIRDALVERVETAPARRRRPHRSTVVAVVTAFVVGGALTGGLTAAAAAGSGDQSAVESLMATTARYDMSETTHGRLVGAPVFQQLSGPAEIRLPSRPAGADAIEVVFTCTDPGTFSQRWGSLPVGEAGPCTVGSPDAAAYRSVSGTGRSFTVSGPDSARYAVWISWARFPTLARASAQQDAETADGKATFAEYTTAFNRLQACMAEAGHPMGIVPFADERYDYAYASDGSVAFDTECYPREFEAVDTLWQNEHPVP